jgi:hypothetical protein
MSAVNVPDTIGSSLPAVAEVHVDAAGVDCSWRLIERVRMRSSWPFTWRLAKREADVVRTLAERAARVASA